MGHYLCNVDWIKSFVNVHLHCITSNVPYQMRKYSGPPELLRMTSRSRALAKFQSNGNSTENNELFE